MFQAGLDSQLRCLNVRVLPGDGLTFAVVEQLAEVPQPGSDDIVFSVEERRQLEIARIRSCVEPWCHLSISSILDDLFVTCTSWYSRCKKDFVDRVPHHGYLCTVLSATDQMIPLDISTGVTTVAVFLFGL